MTDASLNILCDRSVVALFENVNALPRDTVIRASHGIWGNASAAP
jgi:hypothetical protein